MSDKNVIHNNIIEVNVENRPTKLIHRNNVIRIDYLQYETGKYRIWIYFLNIIINEKEWVVTYDTDYLPYIKWFDKEPEPVSEFTLWKRK